MVKQIFLQSGDFLDIIRDYLFFHNVDYEEKDFWTHDTDLVGNHGGFYIPDSLIDNLDILLILPYAVFNSICEYNVSKQRLQKFLKKNYVWVWGDFDGIGELIGYKDKPYYFENLDHHNITFFIDGPLFDTYGLNVQILPNSFFLYTPRIPHGNVIKKSCQYDFLLTAIIRDRTRHRTILKNELENSWINNRGLISFHTSDTLDRDWIGQKTPGITWLTTTLSADLYRQCWFEIVPESLFEYGFFYTEKTNKTIGTKTPFLMVATKGHLEYLNSLGFKTFNSLIDESYDKVESITDRVKLVISQAENIIKNGSESFYNSAKSILDYNYNHLCEITGDRTRLMDEFITQQLEIIRFKP